MALDNVVIQETLAENQSEYDSINDSVKTKLLEKLDAALIAADPDITDDQRNDIKSSVSQFLSTSTGDLIGDCVGLALTAHAKCVDIGDVGKLSKVVAKYTPVIGPTMNVSISMSEGTPFGEALATAIAGNIAGTIAGTVAGGVLTAGVAAILGPGILAGGAAAVVGTGVGLLVNYGISNWASGEAGNAYHYHLGPDVEERYDAASNKMIVKVLNGDLSLALKNYWKDSITYQNENVIMPDGTLYESLSGWRIEQKTTDRTPVVIEFENIGIGNLNIRHSGFSTLTDFAIEPATSENLKIVNYILKKHGEDFEAMVDDGSTYHRIKNYYIADSAEATAFANDVINMSDENKQKALHALINLRSFIEEGVSKFEDIDLKQYSNQYIKDRAQFLYAYTRENMGMTVHPGIYFEDDGVDPSFTAGLQAGQIQYYWGRKGNGSQFDDHLYGTDGNDTLVGNDGEDYIEGGKGQDTLKGGLKKDTFFIMDKDSDYDVFNGGHGEDTIKGSEKDDAIRVHKFEGENTVEKIDGGGGDYDTLEGTSDRDIIDLSATSLEKIHEIALYSKMPGMSLADYSDDLYLNDQSYDSTLEKIDGGKGADDTIIGKSREGSEDDDIILDLEGLEISGIEMIQTGAGSDQINLLNAVIDGDSLSIEAGDGKNTVDLEGVQASGTELTALRTGKDNDTVNLKNSAFQRINIIDADDGDNSIDLIGVQTSQIETIIGGVNPEIPVVVTMTAEQYQMLP